MPETLEAKDGLLDNVMYGKYTINIFKKHYKLIEEMIHDLTHTVGFKYGNKIMREELAALEGLLVFIRTRYVNSAYNIQHSEETLKKEQEEKEKQKEWKISE